MKKWGYFILFFTFMLLAFPGISSASSTTHIYLDGIELQQPGDASADIVNGNVMVPLRVIAEGLGYDVKWEQKTETVTIAQDKNSLQLVLNNEQALVGTHTITLSTPPFLQNNTTMVPLRFVGEQMGLGVSWDNATKSAYLYSPTGGSGEGVGSSESNAPSIVDEPVTLPVSNENEGAIPNPNAPNPDTSTPNESNGSNGSQAQADTAKIDGISYNDQRLTILASANIETKVFTLSEPSRIVIDIPNAIFSDSYQNLLLNEYGKLEGNVSVENDEKVSEVRYSLFSSSPSTVRVVLNLKKDSTYEILNFGDGQVSVELTEKRDTGRKLVVIDAGHGGSQPGAIGITKKVEKDFTLAVALKVENLLKQDGSIDYVFTRTTDVKLTLQERVKVANDLKADAFVSIHGNSLEAAKGNPTGTETYYSRDESIPFANVMHKQLVGATGLSDRKVRKSSLHVTRETTMPAVLLEVGYLSNTGDEALMYTEQFQQRVAEGIVAGIKEYLGL